MQGHGTTHVDERLVAVALSKGKRLAPIRFS